MLQLPVRDRQIPSAHEEDVRQGRANAARLALAWNAHDELVAALKEIVDTSDNCEEVADWYAAHDRLVRLARKAIISATGN